MSVVSPTPRWNSSECSKIGVRISFQHVASLVMKAQEFGLEVEHAAFLPGAMLSFLDRKGKPTAAARRDERHRQEGKPSGRHQLHPYE